MKRHPKLQVNIASQKSTNHPGDTNPWIRILNKN
ncbi:hypothetical protein BPC006_II0927 [Burkholderia pseudomallei BPC006]|nr:hypothetical protein BPC006_II0927 [Burkholderia pseudomallei BPC006]